MSWTDFFPYLIVMAGVTYLIRMLPLTLFQKEIKNRFLKSFLAYVPCACLTAMTFPAILYATEHLFSGIFALAVAIALAWWGKSLFTVSVLCCVTVVVFELFLI